MLGTAPAAHARALHECEAKDFTCKEWKLKQSKFNRDGVKLVKGVDVQ
jgi:hypothetical protein